MCLGWDEGRELEQKLTRRTKREGRGSGGIGFGTFIEGQVQISGRSRQRPGALLAPRNQPAAAGRVVEIQLPSLLAHRC